MEEDLGGFLELVGIFGGKIMDGATLGASPVDLRVTLKVVFQAAGDVIALRDDAHALWEVLQDLW